MNGFAPDLHQAVERQTVGDDWREHGLVFTTKIGTPIEARNLNRHFGRLCEEAGPLRIRE
jgi:integrase